MSRRHEPSEVLRCHSWQSDQLSLSGHTTCRLPSRQECAWECSKVEVSAKGKQERPSLPPDNDDSEQEEEEYLGTKMGPKATLPNFLHKVSILDGLHREGRSQYRRGRPCNVPLHSEDMCEQQQDRATMQCTPPAWASAAAGLHARPSSSSRLGSAKQVWSYAEPLISQAAPILCFAGSRARCRWQPPLVKFLCTCAELPANLRCSPSVPSCPSASSSAG